jgi:hypothetical protein
MPSTEDWIRLGRAVKDARKRAGYRDMKIWAGKVGRSTRMLQGLERGEPVGGGTLELVEDALERHRGWTLDLLAGGEPVGPVGDAPGFVAKTERTQVPIPSRGGDEQGLREEIARVRQEMDERFSRLEDDVRAIREAVVGDGGT